MFAVTFDGRVLFRSCHVRRCKSWAYKCGILHDDHTRIIRIEYFE